MIVSRDSSVPVTAEQWGALRERWPHADRVAVALRLAQDVDTCAALLDGDPVDPARLDASGLAWARKRALVRLDTHAIDLLDLREEA